MYHYDPAECFECAEKENALDDVRYWFQAICDQLYGKEAFDEENLERYLEELAFCIESKIPICPMAVGQKPTEPVLEGWKKYNQEYFKSLAAGV